ncbi:hypothetical protein [Dongia rigui]|nr:hypothetical protein [Dongia rigui]
MAATGPSVDTQPGVDVDTLRRKFLGTAKDSEAAPANASTAATPVKVFRVEPEHGGPSRVAELRNGKINIVSG